MEVSVKNFRQGELFVVNFTFGDMPVLSRRCSGPPYVTCF